MVSCPAERDTTISQGVVPASTDGSGIHPDSPLGGPASWIWYQPAWLASTGTQVGAPNVIGVRVPTCAPPGAASTATGPEAGVTTSVAVGMPAAAEAAETGGTAEPVGRSGLGLVGLGRSGLGLVGLAELCGAEGGLSGSTRQVLVVED